MKIGTTVNLKKLMLSIFNVLSLACLKSKIRYGGQHILLGTFQSNDPWLLVIFNMLLLLNEFTF